MFFFPLKQVMNSVTVFSEQATVFVQLVWDYYQIQHQTLSLMGMASWHSSKPWQAHFCPLGAQHCAVWHCFNHSIQTTEHSDVRTRMFNSDYSNSWSGERSPFFCTDKFAQQKKTTYSITKFIHFSCCWPFWCNQAIRHQLLPWNDLFP